MHSPLYSLLYIKLLDLFVLYGEDAVDEAKSLAEKNKIPLTEAIQVVSDECAKHAESYLSNLKEASDD